MSDPCFNRNRISQNQNWVEVSAAADTWNLHRAESIGICLSKADLIVKGVFCADAINFDKRKLNWVKRGQTKAKSP